MSAADLTAVRGVVSDVGETLVDESRSWTVRATLAGVTPFTLMGVLFAVGVAGNQPVGVETQLLAAGVAADFIASSAEAATADLRIDSLDELTTALATTRP